LWHEAISNLDVTGVFGLGPHELSAFSRGYVIRLFDHNDVLQYAQYYGILGVAALLVIAWRLSVLFGRSWRFRHDMDWSLGLACVLAVSVVVLVDFPLQVPLIPVVTSLVIGTTLSYASSPSAPQRNFDQPGDLATSTAEGSAP
jgi:O-antigen ligase